MKLKELDVKELHVKVVRKTGNGAMIPFLKEYIGREVYVVVPKATRKLKDMFSKGELTKIKTKMQKFIKRKPEGFAMSMHQKTIKNMLKCFDDLEEYDLEYIDPLPK